MVKMSSSFLKSEIVKKLLPLQPRKIILFGSYAYGTPDDTSDIDICIVKDHVSKRYEEMQDARELLKDIPIEKDILVESTAFLEEHSDISWINTAWYDIVNDGEVLYEKV